MENKAAWQGKGIRKPDLFFMQPYTPDRTAASVHFVAAGSALLAAGYCLYSSSVVFVLTVGDGVYGFTLDPSVGEFILSHNNMKVPDEGKIYAFNEGNYQVRRAYGTLYMRLLASLYATCIPLCAPLHPVLLRCMCLGVVAHCIM